MNKFGRWNSRVSSRQPVSAGQSPGYETEIGLVFVESPVGVSFPRSTVATELGERLMGWLPWDPACVDHVHAGRPFAHGDPGDEDRPERLALHQQRSEARRQAVPDGAEDEADGLGEAADLAGVGFGEAPAL